MNFENKVKISAIDEKSMLRKKIRQLSGTIPLYQQFSDTQEIYINLFSLPEFRNAHIIHMYISSFPWEVQNIPLIHYFLNHNYRIIIPVACPEDKELKHFELIQIGKLERGCYNIWEPQLQSRKRIDPAEADIIIVPGMAFDRKLNRLGFGRGYYDKFLPEIHQPKIALAYNFQVFPDIPAEDYDHKVGIIITEKEIIQ